MTIEELIGKLEQATEGSRELDVRIGNVTGLIWRGLTEEDIIWVSTPNEPGFHDDYPIEIDRAPQCPRYLTSLDAALTLVPEGWFWWCEGPTRDCRKELMSTGRAGTSPNGHHDSMRVYWAEAATPILALCKASLHARQVVPFRSAGT